jgi:hypothetical protein
MFNFVRSYQINDVECLPRMHKSLGLIPRSEKERRKGRKGGMERGRKGRHSGILSAWCIISFLHFIHSNRCTWPFVVLTNKVEHLFICLFSVYISPFVSYLIRSFTQYMIYGYFLSFHGLSFHFLGGCCSLNVFSKFYLLET